MGCTVVERAGALNDGSVLFTTRLRCGSRRRRRASLRARVGRAPLSGGKRPVPFRRTAGVAPAPPVGPEWRSALSRPPARSIDRRRSGEPPWTRTQDIAECFVPLATDGAHWRFGILAAQFMPREV